jgi:hypothetical protein
MKLTRLIRDKMMHEHLVFVYRGIVTSENSVPLLTLLEKEMENSEFGFVGRKRLFMFVLESLQNVMRHATASQHGNMSLVVYSKSNPGYTVTTGNVLPNEDIDDLRSRLVEINKLDTTGLRNLYKQILVSAEMSSKGGAGLGLIEMAKKTGNRLDYDFVPMDKEYSYFVLSKTVDSEGIGINETGEHSFDGSLVSQLERIMAENNVYLIWSGHISHDVGKEVVSFAETRLGGDETGSGMRKRVFSVLVEILENVARYSPGKEAEEQFGMPLAMIRVAGNGYSLSTGNLILNSDVKNLRELIEQVNSHDKPGLNDLLKRSLEDQNPEIESTGNMGLIEMAKKSGTKLRYEFEGINDLYSYYTLTVEVDESSG